MERNVVAALDHPGAAAFAEETLGRKRYVQCRIAIDGMQGREQTGAAGAQDQDVGLKSLDRGHGRQNTLIRKPKATTAAKLPAAVASRN